MNRQPSSHEGAPETVQAAKIAYAATAGEDTNNHAKLNFRMALDPASRTTSPPSPRDLAARDQQHQGRKEPTAAGEH